MLGYPYTYMDPYPSHIHAKKETGFGSLLEDLSYYLGQSDTNYIIFRNVEIFKNYFFQIKKYCEAK